MNLDHIIIVVANCVLCLITSSSSCTNQPSGAAKRRIGVSYKRQRASMPLQVPQNADRELYVAHSWSRLHKPRVVRSVVVGTYKIFIMQSFKTCIEKILLKENVKN